MDFLREIVGGPKNRYKENGYNLDLTYITPRIIAMAFPASGIEKLYRNSIDTIAELLEKQHYNKYITVNISGREVDELVLKNVVSFDWEDHKAPAFDVLFVICDKVAQFLSKDPESIAVFHCNHGKGRTGTIICCFFLYMQIFQDYKQVMSFYARKRFEKNGYGVTQPCQIQYIYYFEKYLANPKVYPQVLTIKKLTLKGGFNFNNPYVKLINNSTRKTIYNTKSLDYALQVDKGKEYTIRFNKSHCFAGDITLELKEDRPIGNNLLISYVLNTAFIDVNKSISIGLQELSPLGRQKLKNFEASFEIDIEFRKCCNCDEHRNTKGCNECSGALEDEFEKWQNIASAFKNRQLVLVNNRVICFGQDQKQF